MTLPIKSERPAELRRCGRARIVMLGDTYDHLDIDPEFLSWVMRERTLVAE